MTGRLKLVLASGSPRRLQLLNQIGVEPDRLMPMAIDEAPKKHELPRNLAKRLAKEKAEAALAVVKGDPELKGSLILAADTVVGVGRRCLPKADLIEEIFSAPTVADVMNRLDDCDDPWGQKVAAGIRSKSPTSVHLAFEQMRRGARLDFNGCMRLEYRIVTTILEGHDFFEGVRALLVDKDQSPKWRPDRLDQIDETVLTPYFEEPASGDLPLE